MNMKIIAAALGAAGMLAGLGACTAASASTSPSSAGGQATSSFGPNTSSRVAGPTYVGMHRSRGTGTFYVEPSKFYLMQTRSASIFSTGNYWSGWSKSLAVGSGNMWGVRYGHRTFVGHVTMAFYDRQSNGRWLNGGGRFNYFEKVRISGILPGNGGSVQTWHWSFHASNWLYRS